MDRSEIKVRPGGEIPVPQDIDAEMALLGSMIADRTVIDDVLTVVNTPEALFLDAHRVLFRLLVSLHVSGRPIDLVVCKAELEASGEMTRVGGVEYLVQLGESYGDYTRAGYYARMVAEHYKRRTMMRLATDLYNEAAAPLAEVDPLPAKYARALDAIGETGETDAEDMRPIVVRTAEAMIKPGLEFIETGIAAIDSHVGGLEHPAYIILAARPSVGKTAMGLAWSINAVAMGIDTVFISIEMTKAALAKRTLTHTLGVPMAALKNNYPPDELMEMAFGSIDKLGPGKFTITEKILNIRDCCAIGRSHARKGFKMIVVDYLQLCKPEKKSDARHLDVASVSFDLKHLVKSAGVTVVALAQLNRETAKANRPPRMDDLAESGAIERDADMIFMLHTPQENIHDPKAPCSVIIEKNRNGPLGTFPMTHIKSLGRFEPERL